MATKKAIYQPYEWVKAVENRRLVHVQENGKSIAVGLGGDIHRPARPPHHGPRTFKQATPAQYEWLYEVAGLTQFIEKTEG